MQSRSARNSASPKASKAVELAVQDLLETVMTSLENSKAENPVNIDIQGKSALGDYMVIASGRSHRHVGAIADHLIKDVKEKLKRPVRVEGQSNCDWVLIDAGDIIVHVFRPEVREFYGIEKMWRMPDHSEVH